MDRRKPPKCTHAVLMCGHEPKKFQEADSRESGAQLTHREKSEDFSRWVS